VIDWLLFGIKALEVILYMSSGGLLIIGVIVGLVWLSEK